VARAASDADAIRAYQFIIIVISWIVDETIAVPFFAGLFVEVRIWKKPETEDPGWFAVNSFVDAGRLLFYLLIEPQAKFIRLGRGAKSRFVYQAQSLEALAARKLTAIQHLQEIHQPVAVLGCMIPKILVTCAPEVPGIATHDFLGRKIDAAIHRFENVGGDLRKIRSAFSSCFRLVDWLVFFATGECQGQASAEADSDPGETEKIAFGLEERLHRGIIDIFLANGVARQF
jgi:hypothetical protein